MNERQKTIVDGLEGVRVSLLTYKETWHVRKWFFRLNLCVILFLYPIFGRFNGGLDWQRIFWQTNKKQNLLFVRSILACESLQTRQMRLATIQSIFCFLNRLHRAYFVTHVATSGSDWFDLWNCLTTHLMIWIRMDTSELLKQDIGIDYQTFTTFRQVNPSHL